jgi:hypothetical protein
MRACVGARSYALNSYVIRRRRTNSDADNSLLTTVEGQNQVIVTSIDTIGRVGSVDIIKANNLMPTPLIVAIAP